MYGGSPCKLGKKVLAHLAHLMCMVLFGFSSSNWTKSATVILLLGRVRLCFVRYCLVAILWCLVGIVRELIRSLQVNGMRWVSSDPECCANDATTTRLVCYCRQSRPVLRTL